MLAKKTALDDYNFAAFGVDKEKYYNKLSTCMNIFYDNHVKRVKEEMVKKCTMIDTLIIEYYKSKCKKIAPASRSSHVALFLKCEKMFDSLITDDEPKYIISKWQVTVTSLFVEKYSECLIMCESGHHRCTQAGLHPVCIYANNEYLINCANGCGHQRMVNCASSTLIEECPGIKTIKCRSCERTKTVKCDSNETYYCNTISVLRCNYHAHGCTHTKIISCGSKETSYRCGIQHTQYCSEGGCISGKNHCYEQAKQGACCKLRDQICKKCGLIGDIPFRCGLDHDLSWSHITDCVQTIMMYNHSLESYKLAQVTLATSNNRFLARASAQCDIMCHERDYIEKGIHSINDLYLL